MPLNNNNNNGHYNGGWYVNNDNLNINYAGGLGGAGVVEVQGWQNAPVYHEPPRPAAYSQDELVEMSVHKLQPNSTVIMVRDFQNPWHGYAFRAGDKYRFIRYEYADRTVYPIVINPANGEETWIAEDWIMKHNAIQRKLPGWF